MIERSTGSRPVTGRSGAASLLPSAPDELPAFDFFKFQALGRELVGTPVVVNIWSSWCGPCRTEAPHLAAAADEYEGTVQFLGIDILDKRADAIAFIRKYGWTYPSIFDRDGEIRDALGFVGQPETLFYDDTGRLVSTWIGPLPRAELERRLIEITEQPQSRS